jgi:hypothetical protein
MTTDGVSPIEEQVIHASERALFRAMANQQFQDEMDHLREQRGEFKAEEEQSYANAAGRACLMAAWFVVIMRDFEEELVQPAPPPKKPAPKRRKRK